MEIEITLPGRRIVQQAPVNMNLRVFNPPGIVGSTAYQPEAPGYPESSSMSASGTKSRACRSRCYRAVVPSGNLTVMVHDDFMLTDSEAIAE